jgi:glycerophosphoryl diester phosphodiesterase
VFDLQGHRGARGLWPENTLAGFARTLALGVSGMELDCAVTRDGVVVVTHDPHLNADCTRDASGAFLSGTGPAVGSLTYAQLLAFDVGRLRPGSAYAARFPQQQPLDGERIPRLCDVLSLVRAHAATRVRVALEVKTFPEAPHLTPAPAPFVDAIRADIVRTGMTAQVAILAFDWRVLAAARRALPAVRTVALTEQQPGEDSVRLGAPAPSPWLGGLDQNAYGGSVPRMVAAAGAGSWGPHYLDLDAPRIAEAHALGLQVVPFTVNDPLAMQRLLDQGVDGMITDRPDVLRELLVRNSIEVPPAGTGAGA